MYFFYVFIDKIKKKQKTKYQLVSFNNKLKDGTFVVVKSTVLIRIIVVLKVPDE